MLSQLEDCVECTAYDRIGFVSRNCRGGRLRIVGPHGLKQQYINADEFHHLLSINSDILTYIEYNRSTFTIVY